MSHIYIAWIGFQRRQVSISAHVHMRLLFIPIKRRTSKAEKLLAYVVAAYKSIRTLIAERPSVVWVQVPQTPALWVAELYRFFIRKDAKVIADCHNACFRPPWVNLPFGIYALRKADQVLVHNETQRSLALSHGVDPKRLFVLEDPPAVFPAALEARVAINAPRPWGLFPAGFADDEPIAELFDAARLQPNVQFLVTGNRANLKNQALLLDVPPNIHFMGFLSREDFDHLVLTCDFVLALTKFDGIQLSVCGEAVGAAKPLVVSDTSLLRTLYTAGAEYVHPTGEGIAAGVVGILSRLDEAGAEMKGFRSYTQTHWVNEKLQPFMAQLGAHAQPKQSKI